MITNRFMIHFRLGSPLPRGKTRGAEVERYIVRSLSVLGAELRHFKRLIVVREHNFFALFDSVRKYEDMATQM